MQNIADSAYLVKPSNVVFMRGVRHDRKSAACDIQSMADQPTQYFSSWRKFRKLTQMAVSEKTGIPQGHLSDLERGERRYNEDHLVLFATLYGCTIGDLISTNPLNDAPAPVVGIWSRILDKSKQKQALQILETFTDTDKKKA